VEGQLELGTHEAPRVTPDHRVRCAAETLAGMAVGARWPTFDRVPKSVREVAEVEARRALDAIAEAARAA
jgi:hypothetical protein